jgi:hypothetical protein
MAVNRVIYKGETLVDLTGDTVTPETLMAGTTAHAANGEVITGTATGGTGSSIELDTTLTEEGKGADAKAVSDQLAKKVGFTDYANGSKAGIITTSGKYGARTLGNEIAGIGRDV